MWFLIEENGSYQEIFSEWKNIVPTQGIAFSNPKNTYHCIAPANFNRDSPKIHFKSEA